MTDTSPLPRRIASQSFGDDCNGKRAPLLPARTLPRTRNEQRDAARQLPGSHNLENHHRPFVHLETERRRCQSLPRTDQKVRGDLLNSPLAGEQARIVVPEPRCRSSSFNTIIRQAGFPIVFIYSLIEN